MEAKQFGLDPAETIDFANRAGDADAVIRVNVPASTVRAFDSTPVDTVVFTKGTLTVQPGVQMDLLNQTLSTIEVIYP